MVGVDATLAARPGLLKAVTVAVILLAGAGLGALRVTPGDDGGSDPGQAFNVVGASSAPEAEQTQPAETTTTVPPATVAPTTAPAAAVADSPTTRPPLSPLPTSSPTTRPPTPTTTSPPPTTRPNQAPIAR